MPTQNQPAIGTVQPETLSSIIRHFAGTKNHTLIHSDEDGIALTTEATEPQKISLEATIPSEDIDGFTPENFSVEVSTTDLYEAVRADGFYESQATISHIDGDVFINDVQIDGEPTNVEIGEGKWGHPTIGHLDVEMELKNGYLVKEWFRNKSLRDYVVISVHKHWEKDTEYRLSIRPCEEHAYEEGKNDATEPVKDEEWIQGRLRRYQSPFVSGHVQSMRTYTDDEKRPRLTRPEGSELMVWEVYDGSFIHQMFTRVLKDETEGEPYMIGFERKFPFIVRREYGGGTELEMALAPEQIPEQ